MKWQVHNQTTNKVEAEFTTEKTVTVAEFYEKIFSLLPDSNTAGKWYPFYVEGELRTAYEYKRENGDRIIISSIRG